MQLYVKVSKFMKSLFLPKYEPTILRISGSYFGRNDDFKNSFWNLLTFKTYFSHRRSEQFWNQNTIVENFQKYSYKQPQIFFFDLISSFKFGYPITCNLNMRLIMATWYNVQQCSFFPDMNTIPTMYVLHMQYVSNATITRS